MGCKILQIQCGWSDSCLICEEGVVILAGLDFNPTDGIIMTSSSPILASKRTRPAGFAGAQLSVTKIVHLVAPISHTENLHMACGTLSLFCIWHSSVVKMKLSFSYLDASSAYS